MKKRKLIFLSLASGILLSLPWYSAFSGILLFIGFVPLLFIEYFLSLEKNSGKKLFLYSSLSFLLWNTLTTWWLYNAAKGIVLVPILAGTFAFSVFFWLFHQTKKVAGEKTGYFSLIIYWITFEYLYINGEISWPWLTLGFGFAKDIHLIQWYEFTGSLGGSLWILIANILLFKILLALLQSFSFKAIRVPLFKLLLVLFIPITYSLIRFYTYKEEGETIKVGVIQPNIDPYNEKFSGMSFAEQMEIMLHLADSVVTQDMDFLVGPETAIDEHLNEDQLTHDYYIKQIKTFLAPYPNTHFVIGATTLRWFKENEELSITAREVPNTNKYYDIFNAALLIDHSPIVQVYHKSKLALGVEKMPYPKLMKFLGSMIVDLGGTTGGYGTQKERSTLDNQTGNVKIAPVICYESVYGEYLTEYIHKGANVIFVITNDGWWDDSPGYMQHLTYSQLRAIETRRSIARSANTGISCFINQKGEIIQPTGWWERTAIKGEIKTNEAITFYTKYGDFIGRIFSFLTVLSLVYTMVMGIMKGKQS